MRAGTEHGLATLFCIGSCVKSRWVKTLQNKSFKDRKVIFDNWDVFQKCVTKVFLSLSWIAYLINNIYWTPFTCQSLSCTSTRKHWLSMLKWTLGSSDLTPISRNRSLKPKPVVLLHSISSFWRECCRSWAFFYSFIDRGALQNGLRRYLKLFCIILALT